MRHKYRVHCSLGWGAILLGAIITATPAQAANPDSVSFTLEGCRNNGTITLPNGSGKFICPDAAYTTGNLGKGWNELDLVPYRLTAKAGNSAPANQTYTVSITLDREDATRPGYDVISEPVLNTVLSSGSCTAAGFTGQTSLTPGVGGIDVSIYRKMTITQAKNTTCVYDYYGRLALGSHLFPGSSLHANLLNESLTTAGIGSKDVSIPVKEISPQELDKTMEASQDSDHQWEVSKSADPGEVHFGDVCAVDAPTSKDVTITVTWTKLAASQGTITGVVKIYATNPASRTITVTPSDKIYKGSTPLAANLIYEMTYAPYDVPAQSTNLKIVEDVVTFNPAIVGLSIGDYMNDVATATYIDKATNIAVPGTTTATALTQIQAGATSNSTATITDSESITGDGLEFSVPTPLIGSFTGGYTAGTHTVGPVGWTSGTQTGTNQASFDKTVYLDGKRITEGTLSDTASLTASGGFTASSGLLEIPVDSTASVKLTVQKTIPAFLEAGEKFEINFTVTRAGDATYEETFAITFVGGGATTLSHDLTGLVPDTYYVTEGDNLFYAAGSSTGVVDNSLVDPDGTTKSKDLTVSVVEGVPVAHCSGTIAFDNQRRPGNEPEAKVQKITVPALLSSDPDYLWEFKLYAPNGTLLETQSAVGAGAGYTAFTSPLVTEGFYTVEETLKTGWDLNSAAPNDGNDTKKCSFEYDPPEKAGPVFTCTFQNTKRGKAQVIKTVNGSAPSGSQAFTFQLRKDATTSTIGTTLESLVANAGNGGTLAFTTLLVPGDTYQMCEIVMPGWTSTLGSFVPNSFNPPDGVAPNPNVDNSIVCVDFTVAAGETKDFAIDNSPPPGGRALTIGFWKNWASCATSSGKQKPVLDQTLSKFPIASGQSTKGFFVGDLYVDTCTEAVSLLNKSTLDGKKKASDPAFNLAAQFVAAKLNVQAEAGACGDALTAINSAQTLLDLLNFDGYKSDKPSPSQATALNTLATTLDQYNNNYLCSP